MGGKGGEGVYYTSQKWIWFLTDEIVSFVLCSSIFQYGKIKPSFLPLSFLYLDTYWGTGGWRVGGGAGGDQKHVCLVDKHPSFPKQQLWNAGTGIPQLQLERHKASLWDLFLAFAMALMKYFINNVNVLDGERTVASHSICTAIATRCSAFICLGPVILKLFIAHVSFFNQSVFGIPCSRDLDKRINSASTS